MIFHVEEDYLAHLSLHYKKNLHLSKGIESLNQYQKFNDFERALIEGIEMTSSIPTPSNEETIRILREIDIILRKKLRVSKIKNPYNNTFKICSTKLSIVDNVFYS